MSSDFRPRVFPDANHMPSSLDKLAIGISVSVLIRFDLLAPPIGILLRPGPVFGTAMPKTAIHEDGDSKPWERHIGGAPKSKHTVVNSESKTLAMQQ